MQKITLGVIIPNDATPEQIAEAIVKAAGEASARIGSAGHVTDLYMPAGTETWACVLSAVPLV